MIPPQRNILGRRGRLAGVPAESRLCVLGVACTVATFLLLAGLFAYSVPMLGPADEPSHIGYALEIGRGRLPTVDADIPTDDPRIARALTGKDADHRDIWTANHPPLFYAIAALPVRLGLRQPPPYLSALRLVRLIPIMFASLAIVLVALLAWELVPGRPQVAVAAAGLSAMTPALIGASGAFYNDSLAFLTSTATLLAAVVLVRRGPTWQRLAILTVASATTALTRTSGLAVVGVAGLAVLGAVWLHADGPWRRRALRSVGWAGALGVVVAATSGWFYLRNLHLYGDLTGADVLFTKFERIRAGSTVGTLLTPEFWSLLARRMLDYASYQLGRASRPWLGIAVVPVVIGLGVVLLRRARHRLLPKALGPRLLSWSLLVLLTAAMVVAVADFTARGGNLHGRYLLPALGPLATAAALGLGALPTGRRGVPTSLALASLACLNVVVLNHYLSYTVTGTGPNEPSLITALRTAGNLPVLPILLLVPLAATVLVVVQAVVLWRLAPEPAAHTLLPRQRLAEPVVGTAHAPDQVPARQRQWFVTRTGQRVPAGRVPASLHALSQAPDSAAVDGPETDQSASSRLKDVPG
jgi:hypothetical protein